MRKCILGIAHTTLTLACMGCCAYLLWKDQHGSDRWGRRESFGPGRMSAEADYPLRYFQQVYWLGGDYELPAGEEHCAVVILAFEDGKFRGRRGGTVWSNPPGGRCAVRYLLMWGSGPDGTRYITVSEGNGIMRSGGKDDFFTGLGSVLHRSYGASHRGEIRGYRIVGYAGSEEMRAGQERYKNNSGDIELALRTRERVVVMGVKPFPTREDAEHWIDGEEEPPEK